MGGQLDRGRRGGGGREGLGGAQAWVGGFGMGVGGWVRMVDSQGSAAIGSAPVLTFETCCPFNPTLHAQAPQAPEAAQQALEPPDAQDAAQRLAGLFM